MRSPLLPLHKAVYERLTGQLSVAVYDAVPKDAAFPFITMGEDTAVNWSTKLQPGWDVTETLHVWSRRADLADPGAAEVKGIIDGIVQALTAEPLSVQGFQVVVFQVDGLEVVRDPDGVTRHGMVRLRVKLLEA